MFSILDCFGVVLQYELFVRGRCCTYYDVSLFIHPYLYQTILIVKQPTTDQTEQPPVKYPIILAYSANAQGVANREATLLQLSTIRSCLTEAQCPNRSLDLAIQLLIFLLFCNQILTTLLLKKEEHDFGYQGVKHSV